MRGQIIPDSLQNAYNRRDEPGFEVLKTILREMIESFEHTYILIDAMDESLDKDSLDRLLKSIKEMVEWKIDGLHLLATSRKNRNISPSLEPLVTQQLSIQAAIVDADIGIHVRDRLATDIRLKKWPSEVRLEIESALTKGAQGM